MQITSNYAISNYSNRNCKKPSFQATVSEDLSKKLYADAKRANETERLTDAIKQLNGWGRKDSVIVESLNLDAGSSSLALGNEKLSSLYCGNLNVNEGLTLLGQFFSLEKQDILDAEQNIIDNVANNKKEAIVKIFKTPEYIEELTGEENPTLRQLDVAIDSLSETELMKYRFDLGKKSQEPEDLINFSIEI